MARKGTKTQGQGSETKAAPSFASAPISEQRVNGPGQGDGQAIQESELTVDEIAARAYQIYEREGRAEGRDMDHWLRAETELREERRAGRSSERSGSRIQNQDLPRSARRHDMRVEN